MVRNERFRGGSVLATPCAMRAPSFRWSVTPVLTNTRRPSGEFVRIRGRLKVDRHAAVDELSGNERFYLYSTDGSHRPMAGNWYSRMIAITWMPMNGSMPAKIWFSVTCGGLTPFR